MITELLSRVNALQNIHIEITNKCNLACMHCYVSDRNGSSSTDMFLSFDNIKRIIIEAKALGAITVTLTGGEPILHPSFLEIIEFAKKNNVALKLMTNGTLISEKNISQIKDFVNHVYLTQYGYDKESYENTVGKKNMYHTFNHAIDLLNLHMISYDINYTMTTMNCNDLLKIARNFKSVETHISYQKDNPYSKKYQVSIECLKKYYSLLEGTKPITNIDRLMCNICQNSLTIKCNGMVTPCPSFDYYLGDVTKDSLIAIWNNEKVKEVRTYSKFENFVMCQNCKYNGYNYNVCIANNYNETGDFFKCSDTTCSICKLLSERGV